MLTRSGRKATPHGFHLQQPGPYSPARRGFLAPSTIPPRLHAASAAASQRRRARLLGRGGAVRLPLRGAPPAARRERGGRQLLRQGEDAPGPLRRAALACPAPAD